jgi:uncharacterized protein YjbI with pentapeptide repeats
MNEHDGTQASTKHRRSRQTSKQNGKQSLALQRPDDDDIKAWKAYWQEKGQTWRIEPEISVERQKYLAERRSITPDIERGVYPFKDIKLNRADVEWLLATHDDGRGPVDWGDESQREREGLDLRGANLQQVDLRGLPLACLRGGLNRSEWFHATTGQRNTAAVLLDGANLRSAHLEAADLLGAHSEKAIFSYAYLIQAKLLSANLKLSVLHHAHLEQVDLRDANLERVRLDQSHMEEADLGEALLEEANLYAAHLERANLYKARLERAFLEEVHLEEADLNQADLTGTTLNKASLKHATLCRASLQEAHLEGTDLEEANLERASLEQAHLERAHLTGANLRRANIKGANFYQAHLERACLDACQGKALFIRAHLEEADLSKAHLEDADLSGAHLERADLNHIHLEGADLSKTHLEDAYVSGAHLEGAYLRETYLEGAALCEAFFDSETQLINVNLGNKRVGSASLADIRWGDTNLAVVNWTSVQELGDETQARQPKKRNGELKDKYECLRDYQRAVRANRQLAVVLRDQGLNEDASRFAYRAQKLQRIVLRQQGKFVGYLFSLFIDLLAGYGYKPWRSFLAYLLVISVFALTYYHLSTHLAWNEAIVISMTAFHGRGFFPDQFKPGDPQALVAAIEAFVGLLIEVTFIATLTQRLFGK